MTSQVDMRALMERAEAALNSNEFSKAAELYERILEAEPNEPDAQLGYVRSLSGEQRRDEVLIYLEEKAPTLEDSRLWAELGRAYYANHRFADAIASFQSACEKSPLDGNLRANLGFAYWQSGDRDHALEQLRIALPLVSDSENSSQLSANMGQIFMQLGMWNEAVSSFERYLLDHPTDLTRRVMLAASLKEAGWGEEAETVLEEVLTVNPDFELAQERLDAMRAGDASGDANLPWSASPFDVPATNPFETAAPVSTVGDLGDAPAWDFGDVEVVDGLAEPNIGNEVARRLVAHVTPMLEQDDMDGAIAYLESQRNESEAPAEVLNLLGKVLVEDGDLDGAIASFREAIELDPYHPQGHSNLAVILWQTGEMDEAVEILRRAIELDQTDLDALANLGLICLQVGFFEDAITLLTKYLDFFPEDTQTRTELAEAYIGFGDNEGALRELDTVLLLEPDNEAAQKRFDELSKQM